MPAIPRGSFIWTSEIFLRITQAFCAESEICPIGVASFRALFFYLKNMV